MDKPKHRLFGFTWLGWLNILILQWFFIRLAYWELIKGRQQSDNSYRQISKTHGFRILKWIVPWTGWSFSPWGHYVYIGKKRS